MYRVEEFRGDLFKTECDVIGHGVNVKGLMGAGIAKTFAHTYPEMFRQYQHLCRNEALVPGEAFVYYDRLHEDVVLNIVSQDKPGRFARLEWIESGTLSALEQLEKHFGGAETIALPKIGCGIGGLSWSTVKKVYESVAQQKNVHIEVWDIN